MNSLAKILFPNLQRWQRRRQMQSILLALAVGLAMASMVGFLIWWQYNHG